MSAEVFGAPACFLIRITAIKVLLFVKLSSDKFSQEGGHPLKGFENSAK